MSSMPARRYTNWIIIVESLQLTDEEINKLVNAILKKLET